MIERGRKERKDGIMACGWGRVGRDNVVKDEIEKERGRDREERREKRDKVLEGKLGW